MYVCVRARVLIKSMKMHLWRASASIMALAQYLHFRSLCPGVSQTCQLHIVTLPIE